MIKKSFIILILWICGILSTVCLYFYKDSTTVSIKNPDVTLSMVEFTNKKPAISAAASMEMPCYKAEEQELNKYFTEMTNECNQSAKICKASRDAYKNCEKTNKLIFSELKGVNKELRSSNRTLRKKLNSAEKNGETIIEQNIKIIKELKTNWFNICIAQFVLLICLSIRIYFVSKDFYAVRDIILEVLPSLIAPFLI